MSLKRVLETLAALGLNQSDANVYIFLAKKGPHTGKNLCDTLEMAKPNLYQCLRNLENKGIVTATVKRPAVFSALPFEKALDILVKAKLNEAEHTQKDKAEALTYWQTMEEDFAE